MRPPLLRVRGLRRSFGATHALNDVDATFDRQEIVAVMGANGAGKSTLVHPGRQLAARRRRDPARPAGGRPQWRVPLTQAALRDAGVRSVGDLSAKIPSFGHSTAATAPWIPEPQ